MKNRKNIIIIAIIIVVIGIMVFNPPKYSNAFMKERIEHKELNRSTFVIYKELTQGGSDWTISEDTKFPDKGYILNTTQTKCYGYNDKPIEGVLTQNEDMSITISSNKTIYCNIYFDKDDTAPLVNKFNIIGKDSSNNNLTNGYTYQYGVTYEIGWDDSDVKEYCISSNNIECNGEWIKTDGLTNITTEVMNLPDGEGLKTMYLFIKDKANNISTITEASTKQITVDRTAPEVKALTLTGKDSANGDLLNGYTYKTTIGYKAEWDNNDVVSICVSNVATCSNYELTNGANEKGGSIGLQEGEGKKTVYAYIADKANNWSMVKSTDITVDQTPPTVQTFSLTGKDSANGNLTNGYTYAYQIPWSATWDDSDVVGACIANGETCTPNGAAVKSGNIDLTTGDGLKNVVIQVKDNANNVSVAKTTSITVDRTLPVIKTFTIVGKSVSGVTLTDSNLYSHTINVGYTFDWTETNTGYYCITSSASCGANDWVEINATSVSNAVKAIATGDGNKTMNAFVKDNAGNISAVASDSIMLDLTAPTVTIAKSSVTTSSITVTLGGSDGSGSGISSYQCRIASVNNGAWINATLVSGKYQCTVSSLGDGTTYTVEGRTIDKSGRISTTQTVSDTTEISYYCPEGTLIADAEKGSSSGGFICRKSASYETYGCNCGYTHGTGYSCYNSYTSSSECSSAVSQYPSACVRTGCHDIGGTGLTAKYAMCVYQGCSYSCSSTCYNYYCPSGWNNYSGSGSSLVCYKAASKS